AIAKTDENWPAAAVRNFPQGDRGRLRMRLMRERNSPEFSVELADHFSVPADPESSLFSIFQFAIGTNGHLADHATVAPGQWVVIEMDWNCRTRICEVRLDGRSIAALPQLHESAGPCYLRLQATADQVSPSRVLIDSLDVDVSGRR